MLLAGLGAPSLARAQFPARLDSDGGLFEAGIASATIDGYARSSLSDLAASLWGVRSRLSGIGSASVTRFGSGNVSAYGELHGAAALSPDEHNLASIRLDGGGGSYHGRTSSRYVETSVVLGRKTGSGSGAGWIAAGLGSAGDVMMHGTAHGEVGGALIAPSAMIDAVLRYATVASWRYADAEVHAQWAPLMRRRSGIARLAVGVDAGMRIASPFPGRQAWLAGTGTLRIAGPVSLVGYAGAQPADPMRGTPGVAFTSVALRFSPTAGRTVPVASAVVARATSVSAEGADGRRVVTVRLAGAGSVELMGDITAWLPVAMDRVAPGVWQARLLIDEGSHRLNVRADSGAWGPPPGLPVSDDEFGGRVGILVVP